MPESLYVEKAKVFDLVGGNLSFLDTIATLMAVCIDKFESIKSMTAEHAPYANPLYWTDKDDEDSAIAGTSANDFASEFLVNAELILAEIYKLKTKVRSERYTDTTDYKTTYQRTLALSYEFFTHYKEMVDAMVSGFLSHQDNFVPLTHNLASFTGITFQQNIKSAIATAGAIAGNPATTPIDADGNGGNNRATNVANMNKQQIRTFKRMVQLVSENWSVASIALTKTLAKFTASDLMSAGMGIGSGATNFSDLLKFISSLQAEGEKLVDKVEEYIDIAKDSEDGDPLYEDSSIKTTLSSYLTHFDGSEATSTAGDLLYKVYNVSKEFVEDKAYGADADLITTWDAADKFTAAPTP